MLRTKIFLSIAFLCTGYMLLGCMSHPKTTSEAKVNQKKVITEAAMTTTTVTTTTATTETTAATATTATTMTTLKTYSPTTENVKFLGRSIRMKDILWCSLSATGIEFDFEGTQLEINIQGDSSVGTSLGSGHEPRIGVFLDNKLIIDTMIDIPVKNLKIYEGPSTKGRVRLVKLSESSDSTIGIREILLTGNSLTPTPEKALKIEFVGDSITCGYGVNGTLEDTYKTSNENATEAYAYLTAQKLEADYSLVSYSGYGVLSGYTDTGIIHTGALLPNFYNKFGRSNGTILVAISPDQINWDFNKFVPDVVVVNLGTNDFSYCGSDEEKSKQFQLVYIEFLKTIRGYNPQAKIVCTLGIMGAGLYPSVEKAVEMYTLETGDTEISSMKFNEQLEVDGYGVDWHPSVVTQEKAADQLVAYLKSILKN